MQLSDASPGCPAPAGSQRYCPVMRTPLTVANCIAPGMNGDDGPMCTTLRHHKNVKASGSSQLAANSVTVCGLIYSSMSLPT